MTIATRYSRSQALPEFDAYPSYNYLDMNFGFGRGAKLLDKSPFHTDGDITTAAWAAGLHHRCLDFNPATLDYVEIPASFTQLDFTSEKFSLVVRFKVDDLTNNRYFITRGLANTDGYRLRVNVNGSLWFFTSQVAAEQNTQSSAADIATGTWYTAGLSRSGTAVTLYKNGADVTSVSGTHTDPVTCARSAKIGIYDNKAGNPFDGKIEFFRIFGDIALPAEAHLWFHNQLK